MKMKMKSILSILLSLVLVMGLMPGMTMPAQAAQAIVLGEGSLEGANTSRNLAVGENGDIHIVFRQNDGSIVYKKSTDGGSSFSDAITVASGSEAEVAVSSNGKVYVAYKGDDGSFYIAYSSNGEAFTPVAVSDQESTDEISDADIAAFRQQYDLPEEQYPDDMIRQIIMQMRGTESSTSMHIAVDGNYVYAITQSGTSFYYSSDSGETYSSHTNWSSYAYSDVHVDKSNHKVVVLKDNPAVVCRVSTDYGVTFSEERPVNCDGMQISVYYSTATIGSGYAYMSGSEGKLYKIDYSDLENPTATETAVSASTESNGRSLSTDEDGNVVVGYVNYDYETGGGQVYYQLSMNGGVSFAEGVLVAEARGANAAINTKTGDVLFLYEKDGSIMLHKEAGVISGDVNYLYDRIDGFEQNTEYVVEVLDENAQTVATYYILSNDNGSIPFIGNDKNGQSYEDFAGKTIKVTKAGSSDTSEPMDISPRPQPIDVEQPNVVKPQDIAANEVIIAEDSITIHPLTEFKKGQMYRLYDENENAIDGRDWVGIDENGQVIFSGLTPDTAYVVKAYIPATQSSPRSLESEGVSITTWSLIQVTEPSGTTVVYDGKSHSYAVTVTPEDASITYSTQSDEEYQTAAPSFINAGEYTVYYRALKENYTTVYGNFSVKIKKAANPATVDDGASVARGGNEIDLSENITLNGATGDVNYAISGDTKGCTLNGSILTSGSVTGTITVNVTVAEDQNYLALSEQTITVNLGKAEQMLSFEEEMVSKQFGDALFINPLRGAKTDVNYEVTEGSSVVSVAGDGTVTILTSGTATIEATAVETENYHAASASYTITVSKKDATVTVPTAKTLTYKGQAQALVIAGEAIGGEMQYALGTATEATQSYTTSIPTGTDAGTYYVWYRVVGDANHNDYEPRYIQSVISKAGITPTVSIEGWTYGEEAKEPRVTGNAGDADVTYTYAVKGDEEYTDTVPTNAGEYTVKASIAESSNYEGEIATADFVINKASIESMSSLTAKQKASAKKMVYNGKNVELVKAPTSLPEGYVKARYSLNGGKTWTDAIPKGKNAGTYTVAVRYIGDSNHIDFDCTSLKSEIAKASITITAVNKGTYREANLAKLTYKISGAYVKGDNLGITLKTTAKKTSAVGTYPITVSWNKNSNYKATLKKGTYTIKDRVTASEKATTKLTLDYGFKVYWTNNGIVVKWGKANNADRIEIYGAYCGSDNCKLIKTVSGKNQQYTFTKMNGKKLDKTETAKIYVVAYRKVNGKEIKLARTITAHVSGPQSEYNNVKKVTVKKNSYTLQKGKTAKISANITLTNNKKKELPQSHCPRFRYVSDNEKIATVDSNGKIKAVGKGTCNVYVYCRNGYAAKVKVTVK